jgi:hypothetical protein
MLSLTGGLGGAGDRHIPGNNNEFMDFTGYVAAI